MRALFWGAVVSGPLALGLWWLAGMSPSFVEAVYSRAVYPFLMAPWSRFIDVVPFPVAPVLVALLGVGAVTLFFVVPPLRALCVIGAGLSVLVAWFVLGWGLNYQRQSWAATHGLKAVGGTAADLESLAMRLAARVNSLYPQSAVVKAWDAQEFRVAVSRAYERAGETDPLLAGHYGDPKAVPFPEVMSWLGIAGIFIPHTGEPLVNTGPKDWQLPFTAAHEAAHLRGWAREDEANFLAFWVLKDKEGALGYSAWGSALLYVASALEEAGPAGRDAWTKVLATLDPGVRGDWKATFAYWDSFKGPVRDVSHAVNNLYLKSQGQSDGIKSYGRMVDLLLAWRAAETGSVPTEH